MIETCNKSSTSIFLEFIAKKGWDSDYNFSEDPTNGFKCELTVKEYKVIAYGTSKQKAKHKASDEMYAKLQTDNHKPNVDENLNLDSKPHINYVGRLQELTQKQKLPHPEYFYNLDIANNIPSCTVKLLQLSKTATDQNKKLAKHKAAHALLLELKQEIPILEIANQYNEISLKDIKKEPDSNLSLPAVAENGTMRLSRLCPNIVHSSMYQPILDNIARIQKFEVTPVNLNELTDGGMYQCLLQLSTSPVSIFHGKGKTRDGAYAAAILNSISYLHYSVKNT